MLCSLLFVVTEDDDDDGGADGGLIFVPVTFQRPRHPCSRPNVLQITAGQSLRCTSDAVAQYPTCCSHNPTPRRTRQGLIRNQIETSGVRVTVGVCFWSGVSHMAHCTPFRKQFLHSCLARGENFVEAGITSDATVRGRTPVQNSTCFSSLSRTPPGHHVQGGVLGEEVWLLDGRGLTGLWW